MSSISESSVITALRRQMTIAVAKQVASAGNLANIDTPGYKAREVSFADTLKGKLLPATPASNSTFPTASSTAVDPGITIKEAAGPERRDGNTVQLDKELMTMGRAAGDFAAAQTALAAKFRLVRYAISESR